MIALSALWLRHAHASHSLDRGAPIHLVQAPPGQASVATTGRYLHARPTDSSARYLGVRPAGGLGGQCASARGTDLGPSTRPAKEQRPAHRGSGPDHSRNVLHMLLGLLARHPHGAALTGPPARESEAAPLQARQRATHGGTLSVAHEALAIRQCDDAIELSRKIE